MLHQWNVSTHKKEELIDITASVEKAIRASTVNAGIAHIFIPHTTAAVTINENADPDVVRDILYGLSKIVPTTGYHHAEGNSPAHIKASLIGSQCAVPFEKGSLVLGTWQGIYLCEFDGHRTRTVRLMIIPA